AGKQGRAQYSDWFAKEGRAPVLVSLGHDPLLLMVAGTEVPASISEYAYAGAMVGERLTVVCGQVTGLPMPASAEIVVEGWLRPAAARGVDQAALRGPLAPGRLSRGPGTGGRVHEPLRDRRRRRRRSNQPGGSHLGGEHALRSG